MGKKAPLCLFFALKSRLTILAELSVSFWRFAATRERVSVSQNCLTSTVVADFQPCCRMILKKHIYSMCISILHRQYAFLCIHYSSTHTCNYIYIHICTYEMMYATTYLSLANVMAIFTNVLAWLSVESIHFDVRL